MKNVLNPRLRFKEPSTITILKRILHCGCVQICVHCCTMQYGKFMIIVIYSTWFDFQNECVLYCGFRLFKYESAANSVELISSSARLSWKVPQSGWEFQSFKQNAFSTAHTHPFHLSVLLANFRFEFIMRSDMQTKTFNLALSCSNLIYIYNSFPQLWFEMIKHFY